MHNNPTISKQGTLLRIFKTLFSFYPVMMPVVVCCILFSAIISSIPSVFMQKVIAVIEANWQSGDWAAASGQIMGLVSVLVVMYLLALISAFTYTRMMAIITQGFLKKLRVKMFSGMQDLPIRYFDKRNDALFAASESANKFANILGPILNNMGNVIYVIVAVAGGFLLMAGVPNVSIAGLALSISIVVPFLNMTKQFAGSIMQVSQQINAVVMGLAGAQRIFTLLDEKPEEDNGYVTLVNAKENADGSLSECAERTNVWAWKHPHSDGTVTYTRLRGDVRLFDVDFGYTPNKTVLHDVSLYAEAGQKVAFVGATGAGKTTITNLINRFYDIADGKIRYDGININKIKKSD